MATLLLIVLQAAVIVLIARVVFSWIRPRPGSQMYQMSRFVHRVTEPVLAPIRRALPRTGSFDFSVLVVLLLISFVLIPVTSRL